MPSRHLLRLYWMVSFYYEVHLWAWGETVFTDVQGVLGGSGLFQGFRLMGSLGIPPNTLTEEVGRGLSRQQRTQWSLRENTEGRQLRLFNRTRVGVSETCLLRAVSVTQVPGHLALEFHPGCCIWWEEWQRFCGSVVNLHSQGVSHYQWFWFYC